MQLGRIDASPTRKIARYDAELNQSNGNEDIDSDLNIVELKKSISSNHQKKDKLSKKEQQKLKEDESLYNSFERLLLEEED